MKLPPAASDQVYVSISALQAGQLTLPEKNFITGADQDKRTTVPSMSFLIRHRSKDGQNTNLVFDLGVKKDLNGYAKAQLHHCSQRQPIVTEPDAADSLRAGGLDPAKDVDVVILSHVHWDHVGTPSDFPSARFVVGAGTQHVLANGAGPHYPAEIFNPDELPVDRTFELPPVDESTRSIVTKQQTDHQWQSLASFPAAIDYFGDGSLYVIDTPGHITGHVNLLARIASSKWVFLGGDCCHDNRIWKGECGIAMYDDGHGNLRSVHMDTDAARTSVDRIKELKAGVEGEDIEIIIAHDKGWMEENGNRFLPGKL